MSSRSGDVLQAHSAQFVEAAVQLRTDCVGNGVESKVFGEVYDAWCASISEEPSSGVNPVGSGVIGKFMCRAGHFKKASALIYTAVELTESAKAFLSEGDHSDHSRGIKRPYSGGGLVELCGGGAVQRASACW